MPDIKIEIPSGAKLIIAMLAKSGYRADIVGGCVRDSLLGKRADDFDITTNASPDEMLSVFANFRVIKTGIKHGTLTVIADDVPYEVTTYRIDGKYSDSRHPDSITFTHSIEEDLSRRDFTINAMAYSEKYGITDLFLGRQDVENKIIRAVGEPEMRFREDALRILRALRFSSVLSFSIEEKTAAAARLCKGLLCSVSSERIYTEWNKLISGQGAYSVISKFSDIISEFLPELYSPRLPNKEVFEKANPVARMLMLFAQNLGDVAAEGFESACVRLKTDKHTRLLGKTVLENLSSPINTEVDILKLLSKIGKEAAELLISVREALGTANDEHKRALAEILNGSLPYTVAELMIDGKDILEHGIRGERVGRVLSELLELVMNRKLKNEREELIAYLKECLM